MNTVHIATLTAILLLIASTTRGGEVVQTLPADCDSTQQAMNACAAQRYTQADDALNRAYRAARSAARDEAGQARLRAAQRAWIVFRDKDCLAQAGPRKEGGSIWPLQQYGCLERHTLRRTDDLRQQACGMEGCR